MVFISIQLCQMVTFYSHPSGLKISIFFGTLTQQHILDSSSSPFLPHCVTWFHSLQNHKRKWLLRDEIHRWPLIKDLKRSENPLLLEEKEKRLSIHCRARKWNVANGLFYLITHANLLLRLNFKRKKRIKVELHYPRVVECGLWSWIFMILLILCAFKILLHKTFRTFREEGFDRIKVQC